MAKKISKANKYRLADSLAPYYTRLATVEPRSAFGVVINAPIKLSGTLTTLKQAYSEDDACHITNLVLRRVQGNVIPEISL